MKLNKSKRFHSRCNFYVLFILMHEPNPTQTTWLLQATQSRHFSIPWKILKCASLYIWVMTRAQWGLRSPNSTINTVQEFSFCPAEIQSELHFFFVNPLLSLFVEAELLFFPLFLSILSSCASYLMFWVDELCRKKKKPPQPPDWAFHIYWALKYVDKRILCYSETSRLQNCQMSGRAIELLISLFLFSSCCWFIKTLTVWGGS